MNLSRIEDCCVNVLSGHSLLIEGIESSQDYIKKNRKESKRSRVAHGPNLTSAAIAIVTS